MLIEHIFPGVVPGIRHVFAVHELVNVDDAVRALVTYGDCAFGMGVLSVFLVYVVGWLALDVVRFVRSQWKYWRKHAA